MTATAVRAGAASLAALLLAACASGPQRSGGFYAGDGPPERVPPNLQTVPDAVPRDEPLNPYANRPYVALGRTYVPDVSNAPFRQRGIASWYGRQFQGNRTASGEPYDMFAMTAAHPTLPIPSYARVTNLADGRSVVVRINDRGPFLRDRIIDLSYAAATRLGLAGRGSGEVEIVRVWAGHDVAPPALQASAAEPAQNTQRTAGQDDTAISVPVASSGPGPAPAALAALDPTGREGSSNVKAATDTAPHGHWSVQLGAFASPGNAEALRDRLALLLASPEAAALPRELRAPRIERQAGISRVLIGDAVERATALQWSHQLEHYLSRPTALFGHR